MVQLSLELTSCDVCGHGHWSEDGFKTCQVVNKVFVDDDTE